jgi:exosortase F-associated protein
MSFFTNYKRLGWVVFGASGLLFTYVFQNYLDFYTVVFQLSAPEPLNYTPDYIPTNTLSFTVNKIGRYLCNDLFAMALIYGLFYERKYLNFAFLVILFGLLVLLPTYLVIFIYQPAGFTSMLSHLHRIVFNPVLMMLLIPAFYFQQHQQKKD